VDDSVLEDVAELPSSSYEPGEEGGSSSFTVLLVARDTEQLIDFFSCTTTHSAMNHHQK
jgi:hypothetical protein